MFRWYKNAKICFAYLADVPGYNTHPPAVVAVKLARSRWFTRGWTLQELLAPTDVRFYSNDWSNVGSKDTLANIISTITVLRSMSPFFQETRVWIKQASRRRCLRRQGESLLD